MRLTQIEVHFAATTPWPKPYTIRGERFQHDSENITAYVLPYVYNYQNKSVAIGIVVQKNRSKMKTLKTPWNLPPQDENGLQPSLLATTGRLQKELVQIGDGENARAGHLCVFIPPYYANWSQMAAFTAMLKATKRFDSVHFYHSQIHASVVEVRRVFSVLP